MEVIPIPSWQTHVSRSISEKQKALEISKILDEDPLGLFSHHEWRKRTHKPQVALLLGFMINGKKGSIDALNHLLLDELVALSKK